MDVITTAILTSFSNLAVKDCYQAFINALKKKWGGESDLIKAVKELENKPNSESRKATIQEEVKNAKVNDDSEIVKLAQDLLAQIKEKPGGQQLINQTISKVKYAATSVSGTASIGSITEQEASQNK